MPIAANPVGPQGEREIDESSGQEARTEFRLLRKFDDGTSLIEACPKTGRTHQIRLHLHQLGHSILGDPLYGKAESSDGTMMLHSSKLELMHPDSDQPVCFDAPTPDWASQ